ncbi:hypothetical protein [Streptomyces camelliae]|uniref:Uncharacterized protein n=1 Tax=Streptomyces camelliae TaxID=3004093 RepID=A0ABY7P1J8_9ACTN|nr:hypothetical protein [Streptomyces sp. HUAS 2-6]WBO63612.1 hypothetical protein O1G22_12620 [Streptomyces sp. HUAS 2-6]
MLAKKAGKGPMVAAVCAAPILALAVGTGVSSAADHPSSASPESAPSVASLAFLPRVQPPGGTQGNGSGSDQSNGSGSDQGNGSGSSQSNGSGSSQGNGSGDQGNNWSSGHGRLHRHNRNNNDEPGNNHIRLHIHNRNTNREGS